MINCCSRTAPILLSLSYFRELRDIWFPKPPDGQLGCSHVTSSGKWDGRRNGVWLPLSLLAPKILYKILSSYLVLSLSLTFPSLILTVIAQLKNFNIGKPHNEMSLDR